MSEIKSEKIFVKDLFRRMWFNIPAYQRPYMWKKEQVEALLKDIDYAMCEKPDQEYFLGSIVLHSRENNKYDLIDGHPRVITLLLLVAVLRNYVKEEKAQETCRDFISRKGNPYTDEPGCPRVTFPIRTDANEFIENLVTENCPEINGSRDTSVKNMEEVTSVIDQFFKEKSEKHSERYPEKYLDFLVEYVLVSTETYEDSFCLFTILNDRGKQLRHSDKLKAINLEALESDEDQVEYAKKWEEIENDLESLRRHFDHFLYCIRMILVKERAQQGGLLKECEDKIYKAKPPILKKGKNTFDLISRYFEYYKKILSGSNNDITSNYKFDNLIEVMREGKCKGEIYWMPPLLSYYDEFGKKGLYDFLVRLDNKCSASWVIGDSAGKIAEKMIDIIKEIEKASDFHTVLKSEKLLLCNEEFEQLFKMLDKEIYGAEFHEYIPFKLDFLLQDHNKKMRLGQHISIEHILPQNPGEDSQWKKDFPDRQKREKLTNLLGNLILLSLSENSKLGCKDYKDKREIYLKINSPSVLNSQKFFMNVKTWDEDALRNNQKRCIETLKEHYRTTLKR